MFARFLVCVCFLFLISSANSVNADQFTQSLNFETSMQSYQWDVGNWEQCLGVCPVECGFSGGLIDGAQNRATVCKSNDGNSVGLVKCNAKPQPISSRTCQISCPTTEACIAWNGYGYPWPSRGRGTSVYPGQEITLQLSADIFSGSGVAEVNAAIEQWKQDVLDGKVQMREVKITSGSGAACNSTGPGTIYRDFLNFFETGSTSGYRAKTYPMMSRAKLLSYDPRKNPRGAIVDSIRFENRVYSTNFDGINFSSYVKTKLSFDIDGVSPQSVKDTIKAEIDKEIQGLVNELKRYTSYNILPAQVLDTIDYSLFDDVGTCTYELDWENKQQVTATAGYRQCKSVNRNHPDVDTRCEYENLGRGYRRTYSSKAYKACIKDGGSEGACHDQVHGAALKTEW
jgi:hypothetical protein